jgi:2-iminobutanoate/2-iminopropanoate deaminase
VSKSVIVAEGAPKPFQGAPYNQAIESAGFLFCAGQLGLDPESGELVGGGVADQTRRALENVRAILAAAGAGFDDVVKSTVFLTDLDDFAAMNEVYREYFTSDPPARTTIQVAALPAGAIVELEVVAATG